jgi:alpha-ribazole phosphatase
MREILLIRHAATDMAGTFCGQSDPELNKRGLLQIEELLHTIRNADIGAVFTSDLRRAHATATAIAEAFDVKCHVSSALREINFGRWEGLTWEQIERKDPIYSPRWAAEYPNLPAPDGENLNDFHRRVLEEVGLLATEAETRNYSIAVVTHAGVLRTILTKLQGSSEELAWEQTKEYCSVVRHTNPVSCSHETTK